MIQYQYPEIVLAATRYNLYLPSFYRRPAVQIYRCWRSGLWTLLKSGKGRRRAMRRGISRKPVEWRQLCAITRAVITTAPTIDDGEWKARIKDQLVALDLDYPTDLTAITHAMDAVQVALAKQGRARPPPPAAPLPTRKERPQQLDPPWRFTRGRSEWNSLRTLILELQTTIPKSNTCG
jgi:hypothetical protein